MHFWTQMSKVVHLSQCTNKICTLFICAVVSSTPDTGAASLGYQVYPTEEQLAWATSLYLKSILFFCETKHLKQKITFCKYIKICNLHIWNKAAPITRTDLIRESSAERSDYKESEETLEPLIWTSKGHQHTNQNNLWVNPYSYRLEFICFKKNK